MNPIDAFLISMQTAAVPPPTGGQESEETESSASGFGDEDAAAQEEGAAPVAEEPEATTPNSKKTELLQRVPTKAELAKAAKDAEKAARRNAVPNVHQCMALLEMIKEHIPEPQNRPRYDQYVGYLKLMLAARDACPEDCPCLSQNNQMTGEQRMQCRCIAIVHWVTMTLEEVSPQSTLTYLRSIKAWALIMEDKYWNRCELHHIEKIEAYLNKEYADNKTDTCLGLTSKQANAVIEDLVRADFPRVALGLWLLTLCGCRNNCLCHLSYRDIVAWVEKEGPVESWIDDVEFWANWRLGKNRVKVQDKHLSVEDVKNNLVKPPKDEWVKFVKEVKEQAKTNPDGKPFGENTTDVVLKVLRDLETGYTTYHFRKHFAARALAECDGNKDAVARRLQHRNPKNAEAFYMGPEMAPVVQEYKAFFKKRKAAEREAGKVERPDAEEEEEEEKAPRKKKAKKETEVKKKTKNATAVKKTGKKTTKEKKE